MNRMIRSIRFQCSDFRGHHSDATLAGLRVRWALGRIYPGDDLDEIEL